MSDLSLDQIAAIMTAVVGVIVSAIWAARKSAQTHDQAPHSYLVIDAQQVRNLVEQLGMVVVSLSKHREKLDGLCQELQDNRRALERNSKTASEVMEGADKLAEELREVRLQLAIGNNNRARDR